MVSMTPRHDYRVGGKFAKQHPPADAFPDISLHQAHEAYRAQSVDMPAAPEPWSEPIERETWFSWRDWGWSDLPAVAFVAVVLAFGAHVAGLWGQ